MNLTQLACEYHTAADNLQERLASLRARLPEARGQEVFVLQRRIEALAAELGDLRIVMNYLKHYYEA